MNSTAPARRPAVRALDVTTILALGALAWLIHRASPAAGGLDPATVAGLLLWLPFLALARSLIETQPPWWARIFERAGGPFAAIGAAFAGSAGTSLGAIAAWSFVHPLTDYPRALALAAIATVAALPIAACVGIVVLTWSTSDRRTPPATNRIAFLVGAIVVLAVVAVWKPGAGWSFPHAHSVLAGLAIGVVVATATAVAILNVFSTSRLTMRIGSTLALALVPSFALTWVSRPLPAIEHPPGDWPHAVVLVTIDTLRADHLGAYGYEHDTSPALDAIAAESVLFERAFAAMPTTDPSHVALLTGRLPRTTGVTKNGVAISDPDVSSLASWFRAHGYRTGAISSRAHLDPAALGLPGFQTASVPASSSPGDEAYRRASGWIERHGDRPFFLWVHFWDPHAPYAPPTEDAALFLGGLEPAGFVHGIHPYVSRPAQHSAAAVRYATALYDAEIHNADRWVGRFVADLRARVGRENVMLAVTSDHGETLGERDASHRYAFDHGKMLTPEELHVPLLIGWPGHLPEGRRVVDPVPTAGLAATLTGLLGEPFADGTAGFVELLSGDRSDVGDRALLVERRSFAAPAQLDYLGAPELGVIEGPWLYVENPERGRALFDDGSRAREAILADDRVATAERLAGRLRALALAHPPAERLTEAMDERKIETLRNLGYIQ